MPCKETLRKRKYDAEHSKFIHMKLNLRTDADILDRLAEVPSMQGYIKRLIRSDIGSTSREEPEHTMDISWEDE